MEIVGKGIISGLALALLIGPVFFTIIQTSLERGFASGAFVVLGVSISDILYIVLAYAGLSQLVANGNTQSYFAYAGGFILLAFGAYYLFIKSRRNLNYRTVTIHASNPLRYVLKGFIINGLSPMVLVFWLGMVSAATSEFGTGSNSSATIFFASVLITVFLTDLIKVKLAERLRKMLTRRFILILNISLGLILMLFGVRLLVYAGQHPLG